ncbi:MAG: hypothetical protein OEY11_10345 [Gammaproteobacteria bacterium]|nr:hypothetical protein [Gammaproteobacteria bacterium]
MIEKSTLQKAAREDIISTEQIEPLYQFIRQQAPDESAAYGKESLKFIRSFGDVFISLGIVLLVIAVNMSSLSGLSYLIPVAAFVALAEWLVRRRRLALPGIVILLSILFFMNKAVSFSAEHAALWGFAMLSLNSLLFYLRYKMPFTLLPLAAGLVAMFVVMIGIDVLQSPVVFVGLGVIVFSIALWFDAQDTKRKSHLSDNAFWLYLLAAPLIVHGVMVSILFSDQLLLSFINKNVLMMTFFAIFFLLALFIDRRVILISTQLYVIYALTQLLQSQVNSTQDIMVYVLIGLAFFVIYFGTYWYKTRRLLFGALSGSMISRYVPDFDTEDMKR